MEFKKISAKEARKMADSSDVSLKRIYKFIDEAAKENTTSLLFDLTDPSEKAVEDIIKDLNHSGYSVESKQEDSNVVLTIKW